MTSNRPKPYSALWADFYRSPLVLGLGICFILVHVFFVASYHFAPDLLRTLTLEDGILEYASAWMYLAGSLILLVTWWQRRDARYRMWVGLCAIAFFVMAGEEMSWGQRVLGYHVETVEEVSKQGEFNLHNLPFMHEGALNTNRILTLGTLFCGILLPILLSISKRLRYWLIDFLHCPVPHPVLAICFAASYAWYRMYHPISPFPMAVEESRETSIALGLVAYALLVWRLDWYSLIVRSSGAGNDVPESMTDARNPVLARS